MNTIHQAWWQRITLLIVLAYEGLGALLGGSFLVAAPDGHLMSIPVSVLHGYFPDFLIPGIILLALGILNVLTFFVVYFRSRYAWLFAGLSLVGFIIWFTVEIAVVQEVNLLHVMWGVPVLIGFFAALPLIPQRRSVYTHA